jgi:hypothetical protein
MRTRSLHLPRSFGTALYAVPTLVLLAGCQSTPPAPPSSELQLLEAAPLALARDCTASGSYIVTFVVGTSGRADAVRTENAPACVEQALSAWVQSFRYTPPQQATPSAIEWMMVTAKRGS